MGSILADGASADGERGKSLCFVLDPDFGFMQDFSRSLRAAGVDTIQLLNSTRLADNIDDHYPDIIFIDLSPTHPYDCVRALLTLKECRFAGRVQLMGRCETAFLDNFRNIGSDSSLTMLPVMQKPINFASVTQIILDQKLSSKPVPSPELSLKTAIARDLITFWYQPKIDLKKRRVIGAECFARILHPLHGVISPMHFLASAADEDVTELARRALINALKFSAQLDKMGIHLKIAINASVEALLNFPAELVMKHRPQNDQWPGLLVEVTETQLLNKVVVLREKLKELEKIGISLAIDNFGRGNSSFAALRYLPFSEIKIDSSFIQGCAGNKGNASICRSMIQIAHSFRRQATAIGIETGADAQEIAGLDCDIGQGFLFGKPMTEQQMMTMVKAGQTESESFCEPVASTRRSG